MFDSIEFGESVYENFQIIKKKHIFTPNDATIFALIKMNQIQRDSNLTCTWKIINKNSPDTIIGIYEIPMIGNKELQRYAVVGLDLGMLLSEKIIERDSEMGLKVEINGFSEEGFFSIKTFNLYNKTLTSKGDKYKIPSREWQI